MFGRKKATHRSHPLAAFALVTVIVFFARKYYKRIMKRRRVSVAQSEPFPYLDSVSDRKGCDIEGLRFLAGALPSAQISQVTGRDALDPIRVYAGLAHGANADERVGYAMRELERLGAFERSNILVVCPTGRGYVHPIPAETAELITGGDIAIVTVQYHDDQTLRAIKKLDMAADAHRQMVETTLLRALQDRVDASPARPRVHVYGESLGAWASQVGLMAAEDSVLLNLSSGLWSGTPYASAASPSLSRRLSALTGSMAEVAHADELPAHTHFAKLTNADDPIAYFSGMSVIYKPAAWTRHLNKRWLPGVTFAKAILEVEAATRPKPGVREAAGHDYRATVARTMAKLWLQDTYDETQHELVETFLTEAERTRRARMAFLHSAVIERE